MKTMTCAQMGGMCEEKICGNSIEEMLANGMAHLEITHPEMAASIKAMPSDDPKMVEWDNKFRADFAALVDDGE
jgi:predicted small metal-binding protein